MALCGTVWQCVLMTGFTRSRRLLAAHLQCFMRSRIQSCGTLMSPRELSTKSPPAQFTCDRYLRTFLLTLNLSVLMEISSGLFSLLWTFYYLICGHFAQNVTCNVL